MNSPLQGGGIAPVQHTSGQQVRLYGERSRLAVGLADTVGGGVARVPGRLSAAQKKSPVIADRALRAGRNALEVIVMRAYSALATMKSTMVFISSSFRDGLPPLAGMAPLLPLKPSMACL